MSVRMCADTQMLRDTNTQSRFLSLTFLQFEYIPDSVAVRMLLVHQTNHLLKLCVFLRTPSSWHRFTWQRSTNYLMRVG